LIKTGPLFVASVQSGVENTNCFLPSESGTLFRMYSLNLSTEPSALTFSSTVSPLLHDDAAESASRPARRGDRQRVAKARSGRSGRVWAMTPSHR
jgi:hypothetical protein